MYSTPPCGRDKSGPYTLIERDVIDVYREDCQIGLAY